MTKFEIKQVDNITLHVKLGNITAAALGLSSLIRCARTTKSQTQLREVAQQLNLTNHPDFIC